MSSGVTIAPWLSVSDSVAALAFYQRAWGAVERYRLDDDAGRPMVVQLSIGDAEFWVQDDPGAKPERDGGLIRMIVTVDDPDSVFERAVRAGATRIVDVHDEHGWRTGRFADPFGHHWEVARQTS